MPDKVTGISRQNIFQNSGMFFSAEMLASKHHDNDINHHVLTIRKPRSAHGFFQKPLQKCPFPPQKK
jgi:hypothetical protein